MKKGLLLAAGMAMAASSAFAAATTLYGFGAAPIGKGWTPNAGNELTSTAPGVFTWEGTVESTCYFAFVEQLGTTANDWATPNSCRYAPSTTNFPITGAGEFDMVYGVDASWALSPGKYSFVIDTNTNKLTVSETGTVEVTTTYVLHGQFNGLTDQDWENVALTETSSDKWTATFTPTVKGGSFGVKQLLNGGDGAWYANGVTFDADNTTFVLDGSTEGNCTLGFPANTNITATFVPSTKTLTLTGEGGGGGGDDPNPPTPPTDILPMYLVGEMTSWKADDAYKMASTDGVTYTLTCDIEAGKEFKFFGGAWNTREFTGGKNLADGTYNLTSGSANMTLATGGTITFTLVQSDDFKKAKLTIAGQGGGGGGGDDPIPGEYADIYLVGSVSGWVKDPAYKMTTTDGITYTLTTDLEADDSFKFSDGDWDSINLGLATKRLTLPNGTYDLVSGQSSQDLGLAIGGHVTFTLVQSDDFASATLKIEGQEGEIVYPSSIYVIGTVNDLDWAPDNYVEIPSIDNGIYEGEVTFTSDTELAHFSFCEKAGEAEKWNSLGTRWGASENDMEVAAGSTYDIVEGNDNNAFCIPVGNYKVHVNLIDSTVSLAVGTGVAEIEAANGEATYFNLQGIRVANPENGLFIKVVDGKSTKVLLNK